jgi:hypothetical protein
VSWHRDGSHCDRPEDCTRPSLPDVPSRVLARDEPCADPASCDIHSTSPLAERRQRAREAFHDASPVMDSDIIDQVHGAAEEAIETATRVRVTPEIIQAFVEAPDDPEDIAGPIEAAFRAAGFEVEE